MVHGLGWMGEGLIVEASFACLDHAIKCGTSGNYSRAASTRGDVESDQGNMA